MKAIKMGNYNNTIEAIIGLQERGYDQDFSVKGEQLLYVQQSELINPEEFELVETYGFENENNPAENYLVCGIREINRDVKGILILSAYAKGMFTNSLGKLASSLAGV